jgi:glycerophosphoryl diester phosphodiesterase
MIQSAPEAYLNATPHPQSIIQTADRVVQLKVHRALWSGAYPENSLAAIEECYRAGVARLEIDVCMLADRDFLVVHDLHLDDATDGTGLVRNKTVREAAALRLVHDGHVSAERPPLLSEVVALIAAQRGRSLLDLDLKEMEPLPWRCVEELARLVAPIKDRIIFGSIADWNLRRLLQVDPTLPVGFNPAAYLDWVPEGRPLREGMPPRGAYGYLDRHPLAQTRSTSTADYLSDRLGGILRLVPGAREVHMRLAAWEHMLGDGVDDAIDLVHRHNLLLDVWTLDADTRRWRERLQRALASGVDVITTNTARRLASSILPL